MEQLHYRPAATPLPKPTRRFYTCASFLTIVLLTELTLTPTFWSKSFFWSELALEAWIILFFVNLCVVMPTVLYCTIETPWPRPHRLAILILGTLSAGFWVVWTAAFSFRWLF